MASATPPSLFSGRGGRWGDEIGAGLAGHQRMVLHQRLRGLAEARRATVGAKGQSSRWQAGRLARDGAGLGARAKGLRSTIGGHGPNMAAGRGLGSRAHAALALLRTRRAVGREGCGLAGDQRMVLHQGLRRFAKAWRAAIGAERQAGRRQAGRLARDGARLGARAKGLRSTIGGHGPNMAAARGLG